MTVRYATWLAWALLVTGLVCTALHGALFLTALRVSPAILPALLCMLAGGLMLAKPALYFDGRALWQLNLLGLTLSVHTPSELWVETTPSGHRVLHLVSAAGTRRRLLADRSWTHERAEASALIDAVQGIAPRPRMRTVTPGAMRMA